MRLGYHIRGWIVAFVTALALTLVAALPPAYIHSSKSRGVFVGIMIPGMSIIYMWVLHKWLFAPMEHTVMVLRQSRNKPYEDGPTAWTKEMRQLQTAVAILCHENELMRQFAESSSNPSHHTYRQASAVEDSVTPQRDAHENHAVRLQQSMTPATVARDILRDSEANSPPLHQQQQHRNHDHAISHAVLMDVLSSSTKQQHKQVSIRRKSNQAPQKSQNKLPHLQQNKQPAAAQRGYSTGGDPYGDERLPASHHRYNQREEYFSPEAFSTPCSDEEEEELHSFPPTPYAS
jgi:hypothetical protein